MGARVGIDRTDDDTMWVLGRKVLGETRIVDITGHMRLVRATKTQAEVARLRKASELVEAGYRRIIETARSGMSELELAMLITGEMVVGGGVPRFVSVTSGSRSALADAYAIGRKLAKGDVVRIDSGCTVDGYWSDLGRTFVVGEPTLEQRLTYEALRTGLEEQLKAVKSGVIAHELFHVAVKTV